MSRLPVFRLAPQDVSFERLTQIAHATFDIKDNFRFGETRDALTLRSGSHLVELATASGAVWAADESKLWTTSIKAELPEAREAVARAREWLTRHHGQPALDKPFSWGKPTIGGTHFARQEGGRREHRQLDVSVTFPLRAGDHRVMGGGSDLTLRFGDAGALIGLHGGARAVVGSFDAELLEEKRVEDDYRALLGRMKVESVHLELAYYAAPSFTEQEFLYPVYVCGGTAIVGKERLSLRQTFLPATTFGPPLKATPPQPKRSPRQKPDASGLTARPKLFSDVRRSLRSISTPFEAGTSWIGESGGLSGSAANAQGFVDGWADDGWRVNFNWGDANAWESDWRRNDDTWVDAADFVFYTGHANMNGWVLANPDDEFLDFSEVGAGPENRGDLWGQNDLEWLTIAACGPLHDDVIVTGGGDVFARWDGAFDGLHLLMGYGAVTFDNEDEGGKLVQYATDGSTLINAWFRTASEIQPAENGRKAPDGPTIWVGAMWVGKTGIDPENDHAWQHGSVSADPRSPTWRAAMWTTC